MPATASPPALVTVPLIWPGGAAEADGTAPNPSMATAADETAAVSTRARVLETRRDMDGSPG